MSYGVSELLLAITLVHGGVQARTAATPMIRAGREVLFVSKTGMDKDGIIQMYAGGLSLQKKRLWSIPRV